MKRWKLLLLVATVLLAPTMRAGAEVVQQGGLRIGFDGEFAPQRLPRDVPAPVHVTVGAKIASTDGTPPPRLHSISIAINRAGRFDTGLLPACSIRDIQPSTTARALEACGDSVVGSGSFSAKVLLPRQSSFPSSGRLIAFNGRYEGRPAILAHVYGTEPIPTSFTLPFAISEGKSNLGTVLSASLTDVTGKAGYITGLKLNLGRTVGKGKRRKGFINASCPAPKGFTVAVFPFARASFDFGSRKLSSTIARKCQVRR